MHNVIYMPGANSSETYVRGKRGREVLIGSEHERGLK